MHLCRGSTFNRSLRASSILKELSQALADSCSLQFQREPSTVSPVKAIISGESPLLETSQRRLPDHGFYIQRFGTYTVNLGGATPTPSGSSVCSNIWTQFRTSTDPPLVPVISPLGPNCHTAGQFLATLPSEMETCSPCSGQESWLNCTLPLVASSASRFP